MECHSRKPPNSPVKITAWVVAILVYSWFFTDQLVVLFMSTIVVRSKSWKYIYIYIYIYNILHGLPTLKWIPYIFIFFNFYIAILMHYQFTYVTFDQLDILHLTCLPSKIIEVSCSFLITSQMCVKASFQATPSCPLYFLR